LLILLKKYQGPGMHPVQIREIAENAVAYLSAFNATVILGIASIYHHDNLVKRGKMLVLLTSLMMILSTLGLMVLLHPFFGVLYLLAIYPMYAMYKGDGVSRIIMAMYLLLSALVWAGITLLGTIAIGYGALSVDNDFAAWMFYGALLLTTLGNFTSFILLFAARSTREFQKAQRH
jgi:hypothetical protein